MKAAIILRMGRRLAMKMMMKFVRTRQIRNESGDDAAHGKEIGMKSDRLWMIAPAGRLIPNDITLNYLKFRDLWLASRSSSILQ